MVRVVVDLENATARFRVSVCAGSIRQALELAESRYADCKARVVFPIDPDTFFVRGEEPEHREHEAA
jgi:hypothetical protein